MESDSDVYYAIPQIIGKNAHKTVDEKKATQAYLIESLPIISHEMGLTGKIDVYNKNNATLIERKYNLKQIFQGQIYQLWAQFFCMTEMGYTINHLRFYEISTHKTTEIPIPTTADKAKFTLFLSNFRNYNPRKTFEPNPNKCLRCIYCNLCDKTITDNVF